MGVCVPSQVRSEVIMGEMIEEEADSYTDQGDESDEF